MSAREAASPEAATVASDFVPKTVEAQAKVTTDAAPRLLAKTVRY
ncbi:MAG TPA: hypothetical protein VM580_25745 [Labilithrix sp.]|nr:hypothetical protein [Labilithrix sp.]